MDNFQEYVEENIWYSSGQLKINTNLDEPNKIQIGSKHVGIIIGFSEDEFKLDYKIKAPKGNDFEIDNSYKDVALIGNFDRVKLTQYSGELNAGFIENVELNLKYGSSSFRGIGKGAVEIYEQKLDAESIDELDLNAKYSEIEIEELQWMETTSYETDFVLERAGTIAGNFKYGEMEIKDILENARLEFYEMDIEAAKAEVVEFRTSKYAKIEFGQVRQLTFDQSYEDELSIRELGKFSSRDSKYGKHDIQNLTGTFVLKGYEDDVDIEEVSASVEAITMEGKYINATFGISSQSFKFNSHVKYGKVDYDESDVEIKKYIKDGDVLEIEAFSKTKTNDPIVISVEGYEIDVDIE